MSSFNAVKATQYGALERVQEIIEGGYSVNTRDEENVTLLHWAAINNRRELVQYLVKKGADLDAVGGELMSTPLHWATRQGHTQVLVLLLQYGADPSIVDGEGCACLHLAAQFGHTAIVGYLIAKGQSVNTQDENGMTPLMWSCYKTSSIDPTRLLITLGASLTMQDSAKGNTALHWAIIGKSSSSTSLLINKGKSTGILNIQNSQGEKPYDLLQLPGPSQNQRNSHNHSHGAPPPSLHWLPYRIRNILVNNEKPSTPLNPIRRLMAMPYVRAAAMLAVPFIAFFSIGFILDITADYLVKLGMFVMVYLFVNGTSYFFFDERIMSFLPLGIYFSTIFWMYYTWFQYVHQFVSPMLTVAYMLGTTGLWYNFYKVKYTSEI
ncbi:palmitoyltransferase ZDHHC17 [Eurytemora carolleeae]|uniref:palmitoyltransferase ZDHHC17 n=1 Tax=Eurytemora carolleeae TaxID=1294199 RepID=UPI000C79112B|nr:palmitoyltransferase ZDHHC17 [Eurytemora carolleeae]|eukprot:XP_023329666.1 palmitoyltransferase ZDHHC17-like [Eurytemora affinis]